ncbi:MAG: hypothetical protein SF182_03275 [Deltaproteobacteria bacterium]|nr:hypothetical protein [Deltaproteobacteria bacterium]
MTIRRAHQGACAVAALFLIGSWSTPASADPITDENVVEHVQNAQTAADHDQLAAFFRAKAAEAAKSAQRHRGMIGVMRSKPPSNWRRHCERLMHNSEKQAADYKALAAEQQQLAATAGQPGMQHGM